MKRPAAPPPDPVAIARRLKDARTAAGLTAGEVARQMMIDARVLGRCEAGRAVPAPHQAEALARIYGTSVAWLMQGDASAPAATPTAVTPLFPAVPAPEASAS
jgi:transcriptional regulator with XRE-family HTH domain